MLEYLKKKKREKSYAIIRVQSKGDVRKNIKEQILKRVCEPL